jgi:hypothetical protein
MELISKKVLVLLCSLFVAAAAIEGLLLYKSQAHHSKRSYLDYDISHPLAFKGSPFMPWNMLPSNIMKDLDDESVFGSSLNKGAFFSLFY